jgi:hypothetical protein
MKQANVPKEDLEKFLKEATSGDFENLLTVCAKWCNIS